MLVVGRKADDQLCKKITVAESRDVKTGCNLAESSTEGYGSKTLFVNDDDDYRMLSREIILRT
jgi:hypothetical protein